jgi:hypothetical protein
LEFGNLGLAAAAHNAGPARVRHWIAEQTALPGETRAYVRIVTGYDVEPGERARRRAGPRQPVLKPNRHRA